MNADLILARGRVRTLGRSGLAVRSHLAIAGGLVVAAGGAEVMGLRGRRTLVIDLEGAAVLPGFNDAHAHVVYYGLTRFGADLSGTHSVAEIVARLRDHGRGLKHGEWQQGMGYRAAELAEKRAPHRLELDRATGQRPAFIDERGGHARVANSAALAAAGITDTTKDPPGGRMTDGISRRMARCSKPACRSHSAPIYPSRPTRIRGPGFAHRLRTGSTASASWPRSGRTPPQVLMRASRNTSRARSIPACWPTSRFTTSIRSPARKQSGIDSARGRCSWAA